jgi:fido (protein-threonine AMPylation protein)
VHVAAGQMTADELRERILAPPEVNGAVGQDPHVFRLRNLLGIADAGELAKVEAALSAWLLIDLERRRLQRQQYDLDHLQAFHRYIVHDVFGWAGELRTVSIAKGSLFCLPKHFAIAAGNFLAD